MGRHSPCSCVPSVVSTGSLGGSRTICGACRETAKSSGPLSSPAQSPSGTFYFSGRDGQHQKQLLRALLFPFLNPSNLSCHITQPFIQETVLCKLWSPRRSNSYGKSNDAKSLQSCLTMCDPIDSSPPGSPVPGILQARTLEWVAISFSNA